jgi:formylglycine-generating enzyme required for sulfatase activity
MPARGGPVEVAAATSGPEPAGSSTANGMVLLPGGTFLMGSDDAQGYPADGEGPVRQVQVDSFWIGSRAVSNAEFDAFVSRTGYVTEAEKYGWSFVFDGLLRMIFRRPEPSRQRRGGARFKATWRHPGLESNVDDRLDHPVVHLLERRAGVRHGRVLAYDRGRMECAAVAGRTATPLGRRADGGRRHRMNVWQGRFRRTHAGRRVSRYLQWTPSRRTVRTLQHDGNVWEWCADWIQPTFHVRFASEPGAAIGNTGHARGSYLCHASYCCGTGRRG